MQLFLSKIGSTLKVSIVNFAPDTSYYKRDRQGYFMHHKGIIF